MYYFSLFALLVALLFPAPTARLSTSDATQVITLAPVEHVAMSTATSSAPNRAAVAKDASPRRPAVTTQIAAAASIPAQKSAATIEPAPAPASTHVASASFSALESAVMADINTARGLSTLTVDPSLGSIARAHSADMLANDYFEHTSSSGCTAVCRFQNAGYSYWSMGENIYWMEGYSLSESAAAQKVVDAWQNSPGHRENDLGKFTRVGVGIAQSGSKVYVTADFATPR